MDKQKIARELVKLAKELTSGGGLADQKLYFEGYYVAGYTDKRIGSTEVKRDGQLHWVGSKKDMAAKRFKTPSQAISWVKKLKARIEGGESYDWDVQQGNGYWWWAPQTWRTYPETAAEDGLTEIDEHEARAHKI